jgi:hypothetical protein
MLSAETLESRRLLAYTFTLQDKTGVTGTGPTDYSVYALGFASYNFSTAYNNKAYAQNAFVLGNVGGTPSTTPYTFTDLSSGANPAQGGTSTSISPVRLDASNLTFTLPNTGTQAQVAVKDGPTVGLGFTGFTPGATNTFAYEALEFTINTPPNLSTLAAGSLDIDWTSVDQFQFPLTMQATISVERYADTRSGAVKQPFSNTYHVGASNDDGTSYTRNDVFAQYKTFTATEPAWQSLLFPASGQPAGILSPLSVSKPLANPLARYFDAILDSLYVNGPPGGKTLYLQGNETEVLWETAPAVLTGGVHALALWNATKYPGSSASNPVWWIKDPRALAGDTYGSAEYQIFGGTGAFAVANAVAGNFSGEGLGTVLDMLNAAINRGIATAGADSGLYGTADEANPSGFTNPVAGSLIHWETQANFYPADVPQNLYAAFLHTAMINNVPVNHPNPTAPQNSAAGTPMGLAYGFSQDEAPGNNLNGDGDRVSAFVNPQFGANGSPSTTLLGGQIPAVNDDVPITLTLGPWGGSTPSAPTVVSIDTRPPQVSPGTPTPTAPGTVTWDVLFNEPVTGVSAANFALVASAGLTGFGNVQVSPASTSSAATWTVTASTGTGSGTLGLNLPNDLGSIRDASGHSLAAGFTGQVYAVSEAGPTATITIPADAPNPTSAATVTFDVTFSAPVSGLSTANFLPVATGIAGAAVQQVGGGGTAWTVTVGTGTGSGTLALQLASGTGIAPTPTGLPVTSLAYTIRQTPVAPALQSISRNLPNPTDQPQVSWTVSFSEAVAGVNVNNFNLVSSGLSGARITQVAQAPGTGTAWTVTALTGSGTGSLQLDMVNASGITDAEGLAPTGIPLQGEAYDVVRGEVPGVRVPIAFWAQPERRANLVWPRRLVPFTGPANRELTVTLAATGGDGSFAARRGIRGVTVAGTGTGPEISLTGTARKLNAYFRTAGRLRYTPSGESLMPRVLSVSAVTTDTLAGFDTAAILVRGRTSPGRLTIAPQTTLGPTPLGTPLEISYDALVAAADVSAARNRSVELLLGRVATGRLEIWDGAEWVRVKPRLPRFARSFEQPLLAPGGRIRWTPPAGRTGDVPAFTVRAWDGRLKSAIVSQVSVGVTPALDALLSNSHWYVPQENLLAYMSSSTSFTTPPPISLWDQTLWSLGTATDGRFTGSAQVTLYVSPEVSFTSSDSILGLATEVGQIRMRFTPTDGGSPVIGIGQFREVSGTPAMQMQMISGQAGSAYTTHWAYMLPYDPGSFTPPDPRPNSALTSTEWAWTPGTTWAYQSDQLFGPGGVGSFTITDYRNGYFWGSGNGPAGTPGESFTQLGSITPEGNVLFNVLTGSGTPTLLTLTGQITGGPLTGQMALRTYEFSGSDPAFGPVGVAAVVPKDPHHETRAAARAFDGRELAPIAAVERPGITPA